MGMAEDRIVSHDCRDFSTQDYQTGEEICVRCGVVVRDGDGRDNYVSDAEGHSMNGLDHYSGDPLLHSQTENADFVSFGNMGLMYRLNNGRERDYLGKKIKAAGFNDSYRSGCIAGGKGMKVVTDALTGERKVKFDMYDQGILRLVKEAANIELSRFTLSLADRAAIELQLKKVISGLIFTDIIGQFAWRAATLNAGVLKPAEAAVMQEELYKVMDAIRLTIISRCNPELKKSLKEEAASKHKPELVRATS